jgi:diaminopimelate epimerase
MTESTTMLLNLIKCHGSGNDFILIDERSLATSWDRRLRSAMAIAWCDRNTGIGADGILFVQDLEGFDGVMVIYNADGSEAEMCGNGLRCVARYLSEDLNKESLLIHTLGGDYTCDRVTNFFGEVAAYSIEMNAADFNAAAILREADASVIDQSIDFLSSPYRFSALSAPNPHLVAQTPADDTAELVRIGTSCNGERSHFPQGVNVNFFTSIDDHSIFVETFERGVGLTNACGTGMFATSVIAHLLHAIPLNEWITVYNRGGFVRMRVRQDEQGGYAGDLLGNATFEYSGQLDFEEDQLASFSLQNKEVRQTEIDQYKKLQSYAVQQIASVIK